MMQLDKILKTIKELPPLPETLIELEEFRKKSKKEIEELSNIIEKDPLLVADLLKISNSAIFSFRSKVETPKRAISLLGMNFVISIAIQSSVRNMVKAELTSYGVKGDNFRETSMLAVALLNSWMSHVSYEYKEALLLPVLLQEVGKFILSKVLIEEKMDKYFLSKLEERPEEISEVEKEIAGMGSVKVSALIFEHWNLSEDLIEILNNSDDVEKATIDYRKRAEILDVIKTACNIKNPFGEKSIFMALVKVKKYNFDIESFKKATEEVKKNFFEE